MTVAPSTIIERTNDATPSLPVVASGQPAGCKPSINLLGGFELAIDDQPVCMPHSAQRLLALLALQDRPVSRCYVAGLLWPEYTEARAAGSLRSALWRVRKVADDLVVSRDSNLDVGPGIRIDTRKLLALSRQLLDTNPDLQEPLPQFDVQLFCRGLLPDWYEDWVMLERERLRHLRLATLEQLTTTLCANGNYLAAIHAGTAAVQCDNLRESAHRALIAAHMAVGNYSEAVRQYHTYAELLDGAMGLRPSPLMTDLIEPLLKPMTP